MIINNSDIRVHGMINFALWLNTPLSLLFSHLLTPLFLLKWTLYHKSHPPTSPKSSSKNARPLLLILLPAFLFFLERRYGYQCSLANQKEPRIQLGSRVLQEWLSTRDHCHWRLTSTNTARSFSKPFQLHCRAGPYTTSFHAVIHLFITHPDLQLSPATTPISNNHLSTSIIVSHTPPTTST